MTSPVSKLFANFILIFLIQLVLLFFIWFAYANYKEVNELQTWRPILAVVKSTSITTQRRSKGTTYCPDVRVEYVFEYFRYTSRLTISDAPCRPIKTAAMGTIRRSYPKGAVISARINPKKPSEIKAASFSLGINFYASIFLVFFIIIGSIFATRHAIRDYKRETGQNR